MPPSDVWRNIKGTLSQTFNFGLKQPLIRSVSGGHLEVRNAANSAYANMRGLDPVVAQDFVTKIYADALQTPIVVTAQVDGDTTPTNSGTAHYIVVNSNGTDADIGDVWYDDGSGSGNAQLMTANAGRTIAVTIPLTGGTATFDGDSIYIWDDDTTAWLKIGDIGSVSGAVREIRYTFTFANATTDSTATIPANNRITFCSVQVTTPFSGGVGPRTIKVGNTTTTDLFQGTTQNDAETADIYEVGQDTAQGGSATVVRTTIAGGATAGAGVTVVRHTNADA